MNRSKEQPEAVRGLCQGPFGKYPMAGPGVRTPQATAKLEPEANGRLNLLVIEDDTMAFGLVSHKVQKQTIEPVSLAWEQDLENGLRRLESEGFDAILLDLHLPGIDGMEGLNRVQAVRSDVPVLFLTGDDSTEAAHAALSGGAQEYLVKDRVQGESIVRAVRSAIGRQRLKSEVERVHRHQIEMKSQLLSNVSHELRTPLATVHQFTSILADGLAGEINLRQMEYLRIVLANTNRLKRMIGDLLDASRAENGLLRVEPKPVLLKPLVDEVIQSQSIAASQGSVTIFSDVVPGIPMLRADPDRLKQVLTNLLENAIKFAQGGKVSIEARVDECEGNCARLCIADTGCGIPEAHRKHVFERLYRNTQPEEKGLGLGLYISKVLVESVGGKIWFESQEGLGSRFFFTIPFLS